MWRLTMFLLCLVATLSGTLLRQAEAAGDFARSLAQFEDGNVIGLVDGGVGDDSGTTILKAGSDTHSLAAQITTATADSLPTPLMPLLFSPSFDGRWPADRAAPPSAGPIRRHAWLQRFLF